MGQRLKPLDSRKADNGDRATCLSVPFETLVRLEAEA